MEIVLCVVLVENKFKLVDSQIVKFVDRQMIFRRTNFSDLILEGTPTLPPYFAKNEISLF